MKTKSLTCVALLVLTALCSAQGQQSQPPEAYSGVAPAPQERPTTPPPQVPPPQSDVTPARPPASYQVQPLPGDSSGINYAEWPTYPYPQYHNPYYDSAHQARSFVSGTIDWLFNLPSDLVDRFSNYMDGTFFPPTPATSGSQQGSHVSGTPNPPGQAPGPVPLSPAGTQAPRSR